MRDTNIKSWKGISVVLLLLVCYVLTCKPAEVYAADDHSIIAQTKVQAVEDVKMPRTTATTPDAIIFNPAYAQDAQTYTVGDEVKLHFLLYCYGNYSYPYYIEIYDANGNKLDSEYANFESVAGVYTLDLTLYTQMSPGKYTIKCYSSLTNLGESITIELKAKDGEYFNCEEAGTQTALVDNVKKPQTAWMTTEATKGTPANKVIDYQIRLTEMYTGDTALYIVAQENMFNTAPSANEQWILMKYWVKNNSKEKIVASDVINSTTFYTNKGASATVKSTAAFSGERSGMATYDLELYSGAEGYCWVGILLPKAEGYPSLRIPNGYDAEKYSSITFYDQTYGFISIDPTANRKVYKNIADAEITLSAEAYTYNGKAKKPTATVKADGKKLKKGTDYTVSYKNNKKVGNATVTIKGKGKYAGTVTKHFTIGAKKGTSFTVGSYKYKVTGAGEVAFVGLKKNVSKVKIADTVTYKKATYKITSVADKALKGKNKVTSVTLGKNIKKIGKEAFSGCKKLKTITVKSTEVKSVGKNAFKNIKSNATIKVPKAKLDKYKKTFKGKGQGKKVKIKKA